MRYVWKCNAIILFFKKIDSVRTIRPSCNYIYFVYYYIDVCDLTLIDTSIWPAQCADYFYLLFMEKYVKSLKYYDNSIDN